MKNASHPPMPQEQLGHAVAHALTEHAEALSYDITERLRAARARAVAQRKVSLASAPQWINQNGAIALGNPDQLSFWGRLGSMLPIFGLVLGLVVIDHLQTESRITELVEVDSALLMDDLPPAAYTDPGFAQFLKLTKDHSQ